MVIHTLLDDAAFTLMNGAVAGGTTTVTPSTPIDMQGFENVMFIVPLGDVVNGAVVTLKANEVASNTNTGGTALTNTATVTATATSADDKLLILDNIRPKTRYVYPTVERTTQNAPLNGIIAIRYGTVNKPVTQDSTVVASNQNFGN